jgi:hypothetical protein
MTLSLLSKTRYKMNHEKWRLMTEFENMDFLELTSSQKHLLFQAVCNVSSDVSIVQIEPFRTVVNTTRHVEHKTLTVLADKTNFRAPNNMYFQNANELHIHYH